MENKGLTNSQDFQIQGLLDVFLKAYSANNNAALSTGRQHLDEDSLAAFVEGNLGERETQPIIRHLVKCSFCRHVTAELVKLDYAFVGGAEEVRIAEGGEPSRISEVLSGLLTRIFGSNDDAVFAHQEEEDPKKAGKSEDGKSEDKDN